MLGEYLFPNFVNFGCCTSHSLSLNIYLYLPLSIKFDISCHLPKFFELPEFKIEVRWYKLFELFFSLLKEKGDS